MHRWRLLLVDDHALFREGLAGLFAYQDDFVVVGEAGNSESTLSHTAALSPDIVLMDIDMPGDDGIVTTRKLKSEFLDVIVVMLTVHDATDKLLEAIKAGAQGYLVKNIRTAKLLEQLRGLTRGEAAITRRMAARILAEFQRGRVSTDSIDESSQEHTTCELEVLEFVADRLSNKEIGAVWSSASTPSKTISRTSWANCTCAADVRQPNTVWRAAGYGRLSQQRIVHRASPFRQTLALS